MEGDQLTNSIPDSQRGALIRTTQNAYMEIFPTRSVEGSLHVLPRGSHVAVTCSPTRGVDVTLEFSERLAAAGFKVVPHISARSLRGSEHLDRVMKRLDDLQIDSLFVVGGDNSAPAGPYSTALHLLRAIAERDHKFKSIGVAAHPEGHPRAGSDLLLTQLKKKQEFADYLVTQMCFDASLLAEWLVDIRERGISLPAWIGVPGVADRARLVTTSLRIGVGDSLRFLRKFGSIAGKLLASKTYRPDSLLLELAPHMADAANNIAGLHIYSFNQVEKTETWRQEFLASLQDES